jgi:anti-anti-sigma factor
LSGPIFEVEVAQLRAGVKLTVRGEIDIDTVRRLVRAREQALTGRPEWMVIDLGGVSFIDSSGLKFLLETQALSQRESWRLQLLKPADTAMRVFAITGADRHLPFIDLDES